jgi:hypothetical protein
MLSNYLNDLQSSFDDWMDNYRKRIVYEDEKGSKTPEKPAKQKKR